MSKRRILRFLKATYIPFKAFFCSRANYWHIHDPELIPFAILISFLGKKIIWDSHEDYFSQFSKKTQYRSYIPNYFSGITNFMMIALLGILDKRSFGVVAATQEIASKYKNTRTFVVGNESIIENFSKSAADFSSNSVLFIGSMSDQQSFKEVVLAIDKLPQVTLNVAGKVDLNEVSYGKSILGDRFHFLGWLNQEDLSQAMANSTIGLMTYFDSPLYQVSVSPTKFYEFAAAGLPILATPTHANRELIESSQCGLIANGFDQYSIHDGIKKMLSNQEQWKTWSLNGKNWSQKFGSWDKSKSKLVELYSGIKV